MESHPARGQSSERRYQILAGEDHRGRWRLNLDSDDFSISLDSTRLDSALNSLRETMLGSGKDITNLLEDEQRRLARAIVNVCPPGPGSGAKKIGEFAIEHDVHRL